MTYFGVLSDVKPQSNFIGNNNKIDPLFNRKMLNKRYDSEKPNSIFRTVMTFLDRRRHLALIQCLTVGFALVSVGVVFGCLFCILVCWLQFSPLILILCPLK